MARRGTWRALALTFGLAAPLGADQLLAAPAPTPPAADQVAAPSPQAGGAIQLKVRRQADAVELVVEGTGAGPQLQQSTSANGWFGQVVISTPGALRVGPQRLTIPELGFQSVSLEGSGTTYRLSVTPMQGVPLGRPVVSADGRNLIISFPASPQVSSTTARFDITQPGRIPGQSVAPPLQPRAVAPPLGDMAVGTMVLRNRSYLNVSGPSVSMTIRNAPARDVLMTLAQMGGYGFVYVDDAPVVTTGGAPAAAATPSASGRPVSIAFQGEPYARAFNAVLLAAGWQGRLEGRMIMAGPSVLGKSFGAQVSKVYRLNQASAASAADYLASLGASITKVNVITNSVTQGTPQATQVAGGAVSQQTTSQNITTTETYGAAAGPLKGLSGTTDSRLQTITLVGDSQLVAVAENYLRQIDLRQRQVALSVRILDVSLDNDVNISNSFAYRYGNNFIVNDEGRLVGAFNNQTPPPTSLQSTLPPPSFDQLASPSATGAAQNPGRFYANKNFYDLVRASIESRSTKVLASPTLILSENQEEIVGGAEVAAQIAQSGDSSTGSDVAATIGRKRANEAFVTVGEQVITNYTVTTGTQGNGNSCQPEFGISGLTFGARVSKIDDNGFVTFTLSPQITAQVREQEVRGCGPIAILAVRRLDTGSSRVRDGQTLILTGVISDADSQEVRKWPILGDIPLIGQFFRNSSNQRNKRELVILVTPRILDDGQGGTYGYGYQPSTREAQRMLGG
jgi:type IV pilus assembly protein PilQ